MAQYVVIGNGVAAVGCIEGIRKEDAAGKIIVISEEPHPVYCRPLISYYLEGKTNLEKMAYRDKNFYERMGCEVLYGKKAAQIDPSTKQIALNDDTVIPYDKLCIATGSSPFVPPFTGLESVEQKHSFMTIDDMLELESSIPDIYAAGDCTEGEDISFHDKRVLAILPNAYMQGNCAGINMAGGSSVFDKGIPMNSIGFFGLHAMTAGSYYTAEQGCELYEEKSEGTLKRLFTRGDYLTGFILIGATERAGIYTSLIRERIPLSSIDFEMLKKTATSTAFSVEKRKQFFGGVV